jgi:uncharacterized protein
MSKKPTFGHGKICYLIIPAADAKQSADFYQNVFSWNIRQDNTGQWSFDDGVGEVSGTWVTDRKPNTEPGVDIHIMVDNAAKTINKIVAEGGTIIRPIEVNTREITASFADPAGNVFGIYQHGK